MLLEEIIAKIKELPIDEKIQLYELLLEEIAIPLHNPREFFDDWDDTEVDAFYASR